MEPLKGAGIGYWAITRLAMFMLTAFFVAGCGGGGEGNCYPLADECPAQVKINAFTVSGNDAPVNGREQIVAGNNNGIFRLGLNVDNVYSNEARIWVSDRGDLVSTNLAKQIAYIRCEFSPFCTFDMTVNCSFSVANLVSCASVSGGSGPITYNFTDADITPLLSGGQTDLFIVTIASATASIPAQRFVPVTFRYN